MDLAWRRRCKACLQDTFDMAAYRPGQQEAIHALLSGRDVLCILPTGAGKSLCWQLPAVVHSGLTVVISPLIALMRDQVCQLTQRGIPAVALDSQMDMTERDTAMEKLRAGSVRIVFVSPERLRQDGFRRLCTEAPPWMVVVDEAHCILQWGERFRPAYGEIGQFLAALPRRPVICALTATADRDTQRIIRTSLAMRRMKTVLLPVMRENLVYEVRTTLDPTGEILRLTQDKPCKTVIFCRTRERTERLAALLQSREIAADCYHAGLDRTERIAAQERFAQGTVEVLCATTAFGMGVDLPDIRRIIHDEMPGDLIDYAQQTGRAGRDGDRAACILLLAPRHLVRRSCGHGVPREERWHPLRRWLHDREKRRKLRQLLQVLLAADCIPAGMAKKFGQDCERCGACSACTHGGLLRHVPDIGGMKPWQVRAFLLRWQRDALARKTGCHPGQIMKKSVLNAAARQLVFPADLPVPEGMTRLLNHLRAGMHDFGGKWIS